MRIVNNLHPPNLRFRGQHKNSLTCTRITFNDRFSTAYLFDQCVKYRWHLELLNVTDLHRWLEVTPGMQERSDFLEMQD